MNAARLTITIERTSAAHLAVIAPSGFLADGRTIMTAKTFADQPAAEQYADGVAAGLRACGRIVDISIDVPEEPTVSEDDADLLDFASFDAWAAERAEARTAGPEIDAVSARLARDAEAGHYRAAALGF